MWFRHIKNREDEPSGCSSCHIRRRSPTGNMLTYLYRMAMAAIDQDNRVPCPYHSLYAHGAKNALPIQATIDHHWVWRLLARCPPPNKPFCHHCWLSKVSLLALGQPTKPQLSSTLVHYEPSVGEPFLH